MSDSSMREPSVPLSPASVVVSAGRPPHTPGASLNPAVEFTSTYVADGPLDYARGGNPTWTAFEDAVGALEGGDALVFASGTAAIAAVLDLVPDGARVVAPVNAYSGTVVALAALARRGRIELTRADGSDPAGVLSAVSAEPAPALVWLENPTNPLLETPDIRAIVEAAHARGALVAVDNTFSTPLLARPLTDGVDVVVHSATKYLAGHSDVLLGVAVTHPDRQDLLDDIRATRARVGGIAGPMEVWLALRGLRTLHVRFERACANAAVLVERLREDSVVTRVRYPGTGAMISIEVAGPDAAEQVCNAVRLWTHATSLGGVESLLERRRRHAAEPAGVPADLIRLSVGIEDVEDLWRDLSAALDTIR